MPKTLCSVSQKCFEHEIVLKNLYIAIFYRNCILQLKFNQSSPKLSHLSFFVVFQVLCMFEIFVLSSASIEYISLSVRGVNSIASVRRYINSSMLSTNTNDIYIKLHFLHSLNGRNKETPSILLLISNVGCAIIYNALFIGYLVCLNPNNIQIKSKSKEIAIII